MRPEFLKKNDKISFVAPSFGCTTKPYKQRLKKAIKTLQQEGYEILEGPNIWTNTGIVASSSAATRAKEIHNAFASDSTAVIAVGGGELMCEMMPYIDFNIIKQNPKWFMGFSDCTNLTYTITTICDIETIYGVNAPSLFQLEYDARDAWDMLHGKTNFKGYKKWQLEKIDDHPFAPLNLDQKTKIKAFNYKEPVTGRLIGGCLDILQLLCGTTFDHTVEYTELHKAEGIIFFMECCDYNSLQLRRALLQLKNANWFKHVSMFIIGRSLNYNNKDFGISMEQSYKDILLDLGKPILFNIDLGHLAPSIPMRCGAIATIEFKRNNIYITYKE